MCTKNALGKKRIFYFSSIALRRKGERKQPKKEKYRQHVSSYIIYIYIYNACRIYNDRFFVIETLSMWDQSKINVKIIIIYSIYIMKINSDELPKIHSSLTEAFSYGHHLIFLFLVLIFKLKFTPSIFSVT